jgi:hypothetical protein
VWFEYYGRILNIPRDEFWCMPFGELGDLIACHQIYNGAKEKNTDDEIMIPDID